MAAAVATVVPVSTISVLSLFCSICCCCQSSLAAIGPVTAPVGHASHCWDTAATSAVLLSA
jgi:hypothetical protein